MKKKRAEIFFEPWIIDGLKILAKKNERSKSGEINYACKKYVQDHLPDWKKIKDKYHEEI